ncbi:hypothetical protein ACIRS1_05615 [Kitasatospora sp. NPDC101176]|uniref:hypothetical protein n=1 Tax=Kitasatospora sp. NPDC101176 TaxID=3364099 RepID=UPI0037F32205
MRIDLVVGPARAAELVNDYRRRLRELDLLSDRAALAAARTAYADGSVYVLGAPQQVWRRVTDDDRYPRRFRLLRTGLRPDGIHYAVCLEDDRGIRDIPLDVVDATYELCAWPDDVTAQG